MSNLVYQNYSNKCKGWTNPSSISLGPQITSLSGYHSPAGSNTIITINGINFYSYSQITFGTLSPNVYFINSTILQFYIPTNLPYGIYPIQVFNGSIGSNIVTYTLDDAYGLTKSEADTLYLSKVHTDTSTAPLTTFNGAVNFGSTATFYSYAPVCGITATFGDQLVNKDYVDNTFGTFNYILNFSSNAFTNAKQSIIYNFNTTTTITKSNVKAKLDNYANIQQVYTFGQQIPNRWVAVGTGTAITSPDPNINKIAYSSDGITWIGSTSGNNLFENVYAVAWNGNMWIAVGSGTNKIAYSSDGISWTSSTSGNNLFVNVFAVAWNGTIWVTVGNGNYRIAYSSDGIIWYPSTNGNDILNGGYGVAWNGTIWVAVGDRSSGVNGSNIAYSSDGISWTSSTSGNNLFTYGYGVAWNGTMWVVVGGGFSKPNTIVYSYDGIIWTGSTSGNTFFSWAGKSVAWNGTMWVVVGEGSPSIIYSYDGINWTGVTGSASIFVIGNGVAWNGTKWVAVGGNNGINTPYTIAYSYNGVNWTGLSGSTGTFAYYCTGIAFNSKRPNTITFPTNLMVLGGGGSGNKTIAYSYDGNSWTTVSNSKTIFEGFMYGVAWNGTMWVGVGGQGTNNTYTIGYSYNGATGWVGVTGSTNIFSNRGLRVAWNGNLWVAVGGANSIGSPYTIAYSTDGIGWAGVTGSTGIFSNYGKGIAWNGQMWIAVGGGSTNYSIAYSYNGINDWKGVTGSKDILSGGSDVSWNGTMWVAVGSGTTNKIAYSYYGATGWIGVTGSTNIFSLSGQCVAWNGSMWVAGGEGSNTIAYSYYGATGWTNVTSQNNIWNSDPPATGTAGSVIWNGQKWIMTGYNNGTLSPNNIIMAYSSDGIGWTGINKTVINSDMSQGYAIGWNAGLGSVDIPDGSIVLNQYGNGLSSQLDVATDSYYNTGFTNCSIAINSTS